MPEELDITLVEAPEIEALKARVAQLEASLAKLQAVDTTQAVWEPTYGVTTWVECSPGVDTSLFRKLAKILAYKEEFDPEGGSFSIYEDYGVYRHFRCVPLNIDSVGFSEEGSAVLVDKLNKGLVTF